MAQEQSVSSLVPAQLLVGPQDLLTSYAEQYVQKTFCKNNGCGVCFTCEQIRKRQYHATRWLMPEKTYTLDDLEIIFETTALALHDESHFFFILEKADLLTAACSNKLLKILEEPPQGYHFILCTERGDALLPTIKSRCTITSFFGEDQKKVQEILLNFFTLSSISNPIEFLKELEASKINEQESAELLDQIMSYWTKKYKAALLQQDISQQALAEKKVTLFTQALLQLPMPGSSKIFWKNLFLHSSH
jgi:DNA polymerase III gamma/tau subunit